MSASTHHWPEGLPRSLPPPQGTLSSRLVDTAAAHGDRRAIVFGDRAWTYAQLLRQVRHLAGWLQQSCGLQRGDRVLLLAQNAPEWVAAYHGVLHADAVLVPVNAMSTADDLRWLAQDSGARVLLVAADLAATAAPLLEDGLLAQAVVLPAPGADAPAGWTRWDEVQAAALPPRPPAAGPDDLCLLPYTSGTTGRPKGCRHTHRTLLSSLQASLTWRGLPPGVVALSVAPLFHLLGLQNGMNLPLLLGGTLVQLRRWDREAAARLIERERVQYWAAPPAMLVDFFAQPGIELRDLSSLRLLVGGGAAVPDAVTTLLRDRYRLPFNEAYGMTETASFLHCNPVQRPKPCCLGLATFDVDSRVIDPDTRAELPDGETGELVTHAPQVMKGYWNRPDDEGFVVIDGKRFLRTGDLVLRDAEGYVFLRDRLKRMVNVSGYKVWPAEVENLLYAHPAVHEACVVAVPAFRGGEAVKALVVLKPEARGTIDEAGFVAWCRAHMAAYKAPRQVAFVDTLPKSGTGKILWRELQERERAAVLSSPTYEITL
ncbi:MAG: AMP-binding protein [Rubrivivax sp.]